MSNIDALIAEAERAAEIYDGRPGTVAAARMVRRLVAALREMREDRDRLDWIECDVAEGERMRRLEWGPGYRWDVLGYAGDTFRAALDAARGALT